MARKQAGKRGRLRIGGHGSAISIIALSQENPLKAVAEFVENSIDAGARNVEILRGRGRGQPYLKITDDGAGIPRDDLLDPASQGRIEGGLKVSCSKLRHASVFSYQIDFSLSKETPHPKTV